MILYLDASALVKRYVAERGSDEVIALMAGADAAATSLVSRAEVAAALARAVRLGALDGESGRRAQRYRLPRAPSRRRRFRRNQNPLGEYTCTFDARFCGGDHTDTLTATWADNDGTRATRTRIASR